MVIPDDDWTLPPTETTISLCYDEFLVLDWVLCAQSGLVQDDVDNTFGWHSTRLECWRQVIDLQGDTKALRALPLKPRDAQKLLRAVPTTLTWGDGVDHGFSLKIKLARFLMGDDYATDNSPDQTSDNTSGDATNEPPSPPAT